MINKKTFMKAILPVMLLTVSANAEEQIENYQKDFKAVVNLEEAGNYLEAYQTAVWQMEKISQEIKLGQVVHEAQAQFTKIYNEEVVATARYSYDNSDSSGSQGSEGFGIKGLFSFSAQASVHSDKSTHISSSQETTEMIFRNAEKFEIFDLRQHKRSQELAQELSEYVKNNTAAIFIYKSLAIHAIADIFQNLKQKGSQSLVHISDAEAIYKMANDIRFYADSSTLICTKTNYTDSRSVYNSNNDLSQGSEQSMGLKFFLPLAMLAGDFKSSSGWSKESHTAVTHENYRLAHQVTTCENNVEHLSATSASPYWELNVSLLQRIMDEWYQATISLSYFDVGSGSSVANFGNPYLTPGK